MGSGAHEREHNASRLTFFLDLDRRMFERAVSQAKEICRETSLRGGHVAQVMGNAKTVLNEVADGMLAV